MNPILLKLIPFAAATAVGAAGAWYVQGVRLDAARNDLTEYKQAALGETLKAEAKHQQINQEVSNGWSENLVSLRAHYQSKRLLSTCVGKADAVSATAGRTDGSAADLRSYTVRTASPLIERCAETTLQLMTLQQWINYQVKD